MHSPTLGEVHVGDEITVVYDDESSTDDADSYNFVLKGTCSMTDTDDVKFNTAELENLQPKRFLLPQKK